MKAIFDRLPAPKNFPLPDLLSAIQVTIGCQANQPIAIHRIGGVGKEIWLYESQLDSGVDLAVTFSAIQRIAELPEEFIDELSGTIGSVYFGVSDSSFLFVQCKDKAVESKIGERFKSVKDLPDIVPPVSLP